MNRYFFNVFDGHTDIDKNGLVLEDFAEVRTAVIRLAADTLFEEAHTSVVPEDWRIEVLDESGKVVLVAHFSLKEVLARESA